MVYRRPVNSCRTFDVRPMMRSSSATTPTLLPSRASTGVVTKGTDPNAIRNCSDIERSMKRSLTGANAFRYLERLFRTSVQAPRSLGERRPAAAPHASPLPAHRDVAVLGAGLSGMATALRLQATGLSTVVFEAHGH